MNERRAVIRLTDEQLRRIKHAAVDDGVSLQKFALMAVLEKVERIEERVNGKWDTTPK